MKKQSKKSNHKKHTTHKHPFVSFRIISIAFVVAIFLFAGKAYINSLPLPVLGATTGPVLLADHGSDDSGSSDNGSSGGGNTSGHEPSSSGGSGSVSNTENGNTSPAGSTNQSVSDSTKVDCVGPDGRHFTTEFHDCQELNQKWGKTNFSFTPLSTQNTNRAETPEQPEPSKTPEQTKESRQGTLEVQTEGNKAELNLETAGLHIELKREDNGQLKITAKKEDGTEVALHENALEKINESLKEQGLSVSTASANKFAITSDKTEAETEFPLSIDPSTNTLAVTTPNGTKDVTILPNQAVTNVLDKNILTNVESKTSINATESASATQTTTLTEVNGQLVFAVNGVAKKNLLGVFPVGFAKTALVSATNGQVVQVNETILNRILEALSF